MQAFNQQFLGDQVKSINESINDLAKEVDDIWPGKGKDIDYVKQTNIEGKTASLIQKVLNVLPQAAETAATFTPLAPVSKLLGKGVQEMAKAIQMRSSTS